MKGLTIDMAWLKYGYELDGTITSKDVCGSVENYSYDLKGQLLSVDGAINQTYNYDAAGNILSKTVNGAKSEYSYDAGNRLVKSVTDGIVSSYKYDGAGRLVSEKSGSTSKTYEYGWLDKVMKLSEGKDVTEFSYYADGQLAELETAGKSEQFYWDGLALVKRNEIKYLNEPYVTGGNPVSANGKVIFNDMLGSSMGSIENGNYQPIKRTAFGETSICYSVLDIFSPRSEFLCGE